MELKFKSLVRGYNLVKLTLKADHQRIHNVSVCFPTERVLTGHDLRLSQKSLLF